METQIDPELLQNNIEGEIEAIKSLERKLSSNNCGVRFRHSTLDDAIKFICTSPLEERKALLLYLHNSEQPFSKRFSKSLRNKEVVEILNRSFLVLGWDVEESNYHDALIRALARHINLSLVTRYVREKVPVALGILPINGVISVFMCIQGKITLNETIENLQNVEKELKQGIENEREMKNIEKEKSDENDLGSKKLHEIWAKLLGNRDYDGFEFDQHEPLKEKIGFSLKGFPKMETGYDNNTKAQIEKLYKIIKTESHEIAQFRDKIEISFIYNCLEPLPKEKVKRAKTYIDYNPQTDVTPVPIFVLRKCRGSDNPCRVFIDDIGRVYKTWEGYLTKNKLPEYEMIVPSNGKYQMIGEKVSLEKHLSPACHLDTKLLQVGDGVSTAVALVSGAVFVVAAIPAFTVATPFLIGASIGGAGAGIWAVVRSVGRLVDKRTHKESVSFADSEARGAYLNIVSGSLALLNVAVNMALKRSVKRGDNIKPRTVYCVNTIGILNIGAGGISLANSGYEVFDQWKNKKQAPSALTILQLGASVLFFGHAVYSFKGAQTIIDETQARILQDYQDTLRSNQDRKMFNELMEETFKNHGDGAKGKAEVILAIRKIQNKTDVIEALTRNNRAENRDGITFSVEGDQIKLDDNVVDMNEIMALKGKQTETYLSNFSQQRSNQEIATANIPDSFKNAVKNCCRHIGTVGVVVATYTYYAYQCLVFFDDIFGTKVLNAVEEFISYAFKKLSKNVLKKINAIIPKIMQFYEFFHLGISYLSRLVDELEEKYQKYEETNDPQYYNSCFDSVNLLYEKRTIEFFKIIVNSFSDNIPTPAALEGFLNHVVAWITQKIYENEAETENEERRLRHSEDFEVEQINCSVCGGHYFKHAQ